MDTLDKNNHKRPIAKFIILTIVGIGLYASYHWKEFNFAAMFGDWAISKDELGMLRESKQGFLFNRVLRFIWNELMGLIAIMVLFRQKKYIDFSIVVFLFGLLVLLPTYLLFNEYFPQSPITAMLHRITFNPVLILLLIPAFYYQTKVEALRTDR